MSVARNGTICTQDVVAGNGRDDWRSEQYGHDDSAAAVAQMAEDAVT